MDFLDAIKYGGALAFCIGPTFFYLLGVSIKEGFTKAASFALGVAISDILILLLVIFGLGTFFQTETFKHWFNLASSIIILFVALYYLKSSKKSGEISDDSKIKRRSKKGYFIKGIVINGFNPFTGMLWVFIAAQVHPPEDVTLGEVLPFAFTLGGSIFFFDCTKAYLAKSIRQLLTPKKIQKIDLGLGFIFLGISAYFFWEFSKVYW